MAVHEYNVRAQGKRGTTDTTMLLSEEDALAMGLTGKDRVSRSDRTVEARNGEFLPLTEADLNPNAAADELARVTYNREVTRQALEAAQAAADAAEAEEAAVIEAQAATAASAKEAQEAAEKEAAAPKNKAAAAATNKGIQTPSTK